MGNKDIVSGDYMADNEHFADAFNYLIYGGEKVIKPESLSPVNLVLCLVMYLSSLNTRMMRDTLKEL